MIQVAQAIPFPWEDAVPGRVAAWIECLAKSRNTAPEFVLLGALVSIVAAMGPNTQGAHKSVCHWNWISWIWQESSVQVVPLFSSIQHGSSVQVRKSNKTCE